jgi:hypothetical protein
MNVKRQTVRNPEVPIPEIGFHIFLIFGWSGFIRVDSI